MSIGCGRDVTFDHHHRRAQKSRAGSRTRKTPHHQPVSTQPTSDLQPLATVFSPYFVFGTQYFILDPHPSLHPQFRSAPVSEHFSLPLGFRIRSVIQTFHFFAPCANSWAQLHFENADLAVFIRVSSVFHPWLLPPELSCVSCLSWFLPPFVCRSVALSFIRG